MYYLKILNADGNTTELSEITKLEYEELLNIKEWFKKDSNIKKFNNNFDVFYLFEDLKSFSSNNLQSFLKNIIIISTNKKLATKGYARDSFYNFLFELKTKPKMYRSKFI